MTRAFQDGYLRIDFPVEPFHSVPKLIYRSIAVFLANLPFLATITLLVFLPVKAIIHLVFWMADVPTSSMVLYLVLDASDIVLASLVAPAAIYGLTVRSRTGKLPPVAEALRWGRRQWGRTLWNKFKVEVTVSLYLLLLIVPGLIRMVRLAFTDPIVAIEGDREPDPLGCSRAIGAGSGWRIFAVLLPVGIIQMAAGFLILKSISAADLSRTVLAVGDSVLSIGGQWSTVVTLLMYLGLTRKES